MTDFPGTVTVCIWPMVGHTERTGAAAAVVFDRFKSHSRAQPVSAEAYAAAKAAAGGKGYFKGLFTAKGWLIGAQVADPHW